MEIKKIRRQGVQKVITIPKSSGLEIGQRVFIFSVEELFNRALNGKLDLKDFEKLEVKAN